MKNLYTYIVALVVLVSLSVQSKAQQTLRYSNYLFNKTLLNPAAAGSNEYIEAMASFRQQWVGVEGAPQTAFISVDGAAFDRRLGLGLQVISDQIGAQSNVGAVAYIAPRVRIDKNKFLSFGVGLGYFNSSLNGSDLTFDQQQETVIPAINQNASVFDIKAGVYYKDRYWFGGISVFNLIEPKVKYSNDKLTQGNTQARHHYATVGRMIPLSKTFDIIPSVLYKTTEDFDKGQFDFNAKLVYDGKFGFGVGYRDQESLVFLAELQLKNLFKIGYAYDYTLSEISNYTSGSHEILVAYRFIQNKRILANPRYFFNN